MYHGATLSIKRQMTHGLYFRLGYTYAHAIDDGQDALVAGRPATVQNSYAPSSERGNSVTDQRQRFVFSWIYEPRALNGGQGWMGKIHEGMEEFRRISPPAADARLMPPVVGDANQDGNSDNDRLPGHAAQFVRSARLRHNRHATRADSCTDAKGVKLDFTAESFNLFNRLNRRFRLTDDGAHEQCRAIQLWNSTHWNQLLPAYYQVPTNSMRKATSAYAPRQLQFSLRLDF